MVVKFRGDHTPMVLTGATRDMQEKATPAGESLDFSRATAVYTAVFSCHEKNFQKGLDFLSANNL